MKENLPLIMAILVMLFVFLMLWLVSLHGKSKEDFPFGGENENQPDQNWTDNETTGY